MTNTKNLQKLLAGINEAIEGAPEFAREALNKQGDYFISVVVPITPVNKDDSAPTKGQLRRNWQRTSARRSGRTLTLKVYNNTDYASYVEYGHRKRNGKGYVEGQLFMATAQYKVEDESQAYYEKSLMNYVNSKLSINRRRKKK